MATTIDGEPSRAASRAHPYQPGWMLLVGAGLASGLASVVMAFVALDGAAGERLAEWVDVDPDIANLLYWAVFVACVVGALAAIRFAWGRVGQRGRITVASDHLVGPREPGSREERVIPYVLLMGMELEQVEGERYLHLALPDGKYTIEASMLASDQAFDELCAFVAAKLGRSVQPATARVVTSPLQ